MAQTKEVHDWLLANKPELAADHPKDCLMCVPPTGGSSEDTSGGGAMTAAADAEFTKADVDSAVAQAVAAAVADAVAPLQARLAEHEGAAAVAEQEAKIAEAKAPLEATIAELQTKLDEQTVIAQAEKDRADGLNTLIEEAVKAQDEAAELESRRVTRLAKIKESAGFTDEHLAEKATEDGPSRLDRFVAMSDETFEAAMESLADARKIAGGAPPAKPTKTTALVAGVDDGTSTTKTSSAARQVAAARTSGGVHLGSLVGR